jgi:hypothetical protein
MAARDVTVAQGLAYPVRVSRRVSAVAVLAALLGAASLPAVATSDETSDQMVVYDRYAGIRERLYSCQIEAVWGTQTRAQRRACRRLKRRYELYTWPGDSFTYHVHCLTSRCIATPYGEPPADQPPPSGSRVFR